MTTVQPIADRVAVGTRVRHPQHGLGYLAEMPTWGTANVYVQFDEPDEHDHRIAAVLWHELERVAETLAPDTTATALADEVRAAATVTGAVQGADALEAVILAQPHGDQLRGRADLAAWLHQLGWTPTALAAVFDTRPLTRAKSDGPLWCVLHSLASAGPVPPTTSRDDAAAPVRAALARPAWAEQVDVSDDAEPFAVVGASLAMGRAVSQLATSASDRWFLELEQVIDLERVDGTLYAGTAGDVVVTLGHEHPGGDVRLTPAQARALGQHLTAAADRAETITAGGAR